jgi:hypothetical protein
MPDLPLRRRSAGRRFVPALALACLPLLAAPARAQWPPPSVGLPVCTATGIQSYRNAVGDGAGGMFVAWTDTRFIVADVYVQHVSATGTVLWRTDGVLTGGAPQRQDQAVLAADGLGGVYVAWRDLRNDIEGDIYIQHVGPSGEMLWAYNGVPACTATGAQAMPVIAADTTRGAPLGVTVAWEDYRGAPHIYLQRFSPAGDPLWAADGIPATVGERPQFEPSLVSGFSGLIVSWTEQGATDYDVLSQSFDASGTRQWGPDGRVVCAMPGNQVHPITTTDNESGAWVAWSDDRNGPIQAWADRMLWYGFPLSGGVGIPACDAPGDQLGLNASPDRFGGVLLAWEDTRVRADIYAQRIDPSGTRLWPATGQPVCTLSGVHAFPSLAPDGLGGALIAWEEDRGTSTDIYAQRLRPAGDPAWTLDGIGVCTAAATQYQALLVNRADTTGIVLWTDLRAGTDLYCNTVPWTPTSLGLTPVGQLAAAPNPASDRSSIGFELASPGRAELVIYDAAGRRVRTLAHQPLDAGAHRIAWDARDDSGRSCAEGVYFARLTLDGRTLAARSITIRR